MGYVPGTFKTGIDLPFPNGTHPTGRHALGAAKPIRFASTLEDQPKRVPLMRLAAATSHETAPIAGNRCDARMKAAFAGRAPGDRCFGSLALRALACPASRTTLICPKDLVRKI
jgi:hypothetical protein